MEEDWNLEQIKKVAIVGGETFCIWLCNYPAAKAQDYLYRVCIELPRMLYNYYKFCVSRGVPCDTSQCHAQVSEHHNKDLKGQLAENPQRTPPRNRTGAHKRIKSIGFPA